MRAILPPVQLWTADGVPAKVLGPYDLSTMQPLLSVSLVHHVEKPKDSAGEGSPLVEAPSNCGYSEAWKRLGRRWRDGADCARAHLRPRHCPLCHWPVGRAWAASVRSAGRVPGGSRVGGSGPTGAPEWVGLGGRRRTFMRSSLLRAAAPPWLWLITISVSSFTLLFTSSMALTRFEIFSIRFWSWGGISKCPQEPGLRPALSQALPILFWRVSAGWREIRPCYEPLVPGQVPEALCQPSAHSSPPANDPGTQASARACWNLLGPQPHSAELQGWLRNLGFQHACQVMLADQGPTPITVVLHNPRLLYLSLERRFPYLSERGP